MNITLKQIMDEVNALYAKQAEITGEDPDSMPGSENDRPAPEGATNPDPKVRDDSIENEKKRSLDGAKPGSDAPVTQNLVYEADEPVLNAEKKPLDTADANAKEASAIGNAILDKILKVKQASQQASQQTAPAKADAVEADAAKAVPKQASQQTAPAKADVTNDVPKQAAQQKSANDDGAQTISLDMAMLAKIAAITLADEEGQMAVQSALAKRAGVEFAGEVLDILEKRAAEENATAMAQAEFMKGAQDAEAMIGDMQEAQGAADAEAALAGSQTPGEADMQEAVEMLSQFSDEEIVEAMKDLEEEGAIEPGTTDALVGAAAGEGGSPVAVDSDAALEDALTEAIANGNVTEEDLQKLVAAAGGDTATAPAEDTAAAPAEDTAAAPAEEKAAAARAKVTANLIGVLSKRAAAASARQKARAILSKLR